MKCREMNPGNRRPTGRSGRRSLPSMKCREMNPGNVPVDRRLFDEVDPSMKCREMNPGKSNTCTVDGAAQSSLNEVPGNESRQNPRAEHEP